MQRVWPGRPAPLGATWDGKGVNFAVFSEFATQVDVCLFDSPLATKESARIPLPDQTDHVWNGYLPDLQPGQLYGFRAYGPYKPDLGFRFNANKVLLDPYAKGIGRDLTWNDEAFGYRVGDPALDLSFDERDNAATAPLAAVINPAFRWMGDKPPRTPWHKTVIYETHIKGFSYKSPWVPRESRGKYAGVACEGSLRHLRSLGITAVELMPEVVSDIAAPGGPDAVPSRPASRSASSRSRVGFCPTRTSFRTLSRALAAASTCSALRSGKRSSVSVALPCTPISSRNRADAA